MYEMPPILQGNERQQIAALRDYLVRMVRNNNTETTEIAVQAATQAIAQSGSQGSSSSEKQSSEVKDLQDNAEQLRQLILKTATSVFAVSNRTDELKDQYEELNAAVSDFGTFVEKAELTITNTAKNIIENYDYSSIVTGIVGDDYDEYITMMNGMIRRGWIEDPETHEPAFGIAIAESLSFTGDTHTAGEVVYNDLTPGQTFGLYTSTGWQFWIDGRKRGWFESGSSMLHVTNIVSENSFKLSAGWEMTNSSGFGIKYVGA